MYKKIYKSMRRLCLFALIAAMTVILSVAYVFLSLRHSSEDLSRYFSYIAVGAVFFFGLLYVLCVIISRRLAENIVKPIVNLNLAELSGHSNDIYPELASLVNKINAQGIEIERQLVKLKTRKTRFQTVSDNISEGLITLDTDGTILSINKSGSDILGVNAESAVHSRLDNVIKSPRLLSCFDASRSGSREFASVVMDGKTYNVFLSPVFVNGQVYGIVMLILDTSEKLQTAEMRQEFTANVSHELKTPLTTILGYSQIISRGIAKAEDIKGFSQKIEKEASRLITLIDDIIKLSKLDEHAPVSEPQTLHIRKIAEDVAENLHINALDKNVSIEIVGDDFTVIGNLQQITELVYNLCDNAIKYNKENGSVKITLSSGSITFSDTGIGIPREYCERIFERFFRVDKSRSKSVNGTGLGLSIVKHIAESHNAEIFVESEVGKGTSITVRFPS